MFRYSGVNELNCYHNLPQLPSNGNHALSHVGDRAVLDRDSCLALVLVFGYLSASLANDDSNHVSRDIDVHLADSFLCITFFKCTSHR
jgi:hypothetical protein